MLQTLDGTSECVGSLECEFDVRQFGINPFW
jgi:hypothetical protein